MQRSEEVLIHSHLTHSDRLRIGASYIIQNLAVTVEAIQTNQENHMLDSQLL